ncbi:MAG TPA: carbonic anhydrase [Candidatus Binatia bacterium]|jgi:carbonic anhydrase
MPEIVPGTEALKRLREGNERYVSNVRSLDSLLSYARRAELSLGQSPFAIILGCSDSRVPAEVVFDQGLGDLFVIRVAGNIVAPSQVGSVEFAASLFGSGLVVVLGHTGCGAIRVTVDELVGHPPPESENLRFIVDSVRPAVEPLMHGPLADDHESLLLEAGRANVRATAHHLRRGSPLLERLIEKGRLIIVGAEYDLATGRVEFFDGVPG